MSAHDARRRPPTVLIGVLVVVLAGLGWLLLRPTPNTGSGELGPEGVRTLDRLPDDFPAAILPDGSVEVEGSVGRGDATWTASVSFATPDALEDVRRHVQDVLEAEGWEQRQRAFDDTSFQAIWDHGSGRTLSLSHQTIAQGTGTSIVMQGTVPASG